MGKITWTTSIQINAPQEIVWDFTQNYARRIEWDLGVRDARIEQEEPIRIAWVRGPGFESRFQYKTFDRPRKTSLAITEIRSAFFAGGGGSWTYEAAENATVWTVHNTLVLHDGFLPRLLRPLFQWWLRRITMHSLENAKRIIESES